jgi:FG-GAP-like repeat
MSVSLQVPPSPPAGPDSPHRRGRWVAAAVAAAVVAAGAGVAAGFAGGSDGPRTTGAGATPTPSANTPSPATGAAAGPGPAGGARPATNPTAAPGSRPVVAPAQWLWPFADAADAGSWQQAFRERGTQPWHLDPAATATGFAGYLGYPGLDRALRSTVDGNEAYVAVGFRLPDGTPHAAADVHLVKVGSGADAPWEVVGTRDTTLTLTRPAYGSTVTSPMTVGGRITGVDERVVVTLHTHTGDLQAPPAAVAAGGQRARWSVPVTFHAGRGTVLTVAAATGGHVAAVERFAVTGVRVGAGRPQPPAPDDVDGDGRTDTVGIPTPGTLEIHYGSGRTERVSIEPHPSDDGRLIGLADADRDGRDEVFVHVGTGAYTDQTAVFRYVDGRLQLVTLDGRGLVLVSGASVRTALSWACRPPAAPLVQWSGTSADGLTYPGTLVSYRFAGATAVQVSSRPLTIDEHTRPPTGCVDLQTGSPR